MKLTKANIRKFEKDQKENGTATALHNVLWLVAADILHDIGVTSIRTGHKKKAK